MCSGCGRLARCSRGQLSANAATQQRQLCGDPTSLQKPGRYRKVPTGWSSLGRLCVHDCILGPAAHQLRDDRGRYVSGRAVPVQTRQPSQGSLVPRSATAYDRMSRQAGVDQVPYARHVKLTLPDAYQRIERTSLRYSGDLPRRPRHQTLCLGHAGKAYFHHLECFSTYALTTPLRDLCLGSAESPVTSSTHLR